MANSFTRDHHRFSRSAGFTQITATFDATDTVINFTKGNKQILTLTADIVDVHFKFPALSGNFLWAGGSATSLTETANKADIVSIYWDATNEIGYAVASENF